jgi:hypothetical protein
MYVYVYFEFLFMVQLWQLSSELPRLDSRHVYVVYSSFIVLLMFFWFPTYCATLRCV